MSRSNVSSQSPPTESVQQPGPNQQSFKLEAQYAVTRLLARPTALEESGSELLEALCKGIGYNLGALFRVDDKAKVLRCVGVWSDALDRDANLSKQVGKLEIDPEAGPAGRAWMARRMIAAEDLANEASCPNNPLSKNGLRSSLALPLLDGKDVAAVLELFRYRPGPIDPEDKAFLLSIASQISQYCERKRTEEELRNSRERFELAMLGSGDGIWDWDVTNNEVYFSPNWKSCLGFAEHEIRNSFDEWEKRIHPDDHDRALATINAYFRGATPSYTLEHRLRHKDGTYRWILARGEALRDASGRPYRMSGSHTDLTELKAGQVALRDSEALYHSLVETLPLNVLRKDKEGRFTFGNQLFCKTVGKSLAELIGKTDYDFYPPALAEKYRQDDRRVIDERVVLDAIEENRKPTGEMIYVQVLKTPVYDSRGLVVGTQAFFWDVTDRMRAEQAMQRAKEEAESANRAKSFFLANMSHEIRTPMNAIIGMTELMLGTKLSAEQREYLDLVRKSAESLLAVINDILDFSKVEAGKLELDLIDFGLRDMLGDLLNTLAPRAHQKGLELACHVAPDTPDELKGDPGRLGQILVNLVGNAIKFTDHGEVVVRVAVESQVRGQGEEGPRTIELCFEVRDTGIGVPKEKTDTIFEAFAQADGSTTRRFGGTGLGLAIAKRLVELMGGRIGVESTSGQGSTFRFTAQFGVQEQQQPRALAVDASRVRGTAVLIVDDNATNRRILEEMLSHWQMRPTSVPGGAEALAALRQAANAGEPFPLALVDVNMPGMDGYMLAEHIRAAPELAGTTLLILTSSGQPAGAQRRHELGIAASLSKPIKQADLWRMIMRALGMPLAADETKATGSDDQAVASQRLCILLAEDNLVNQQLAARLLQRRGHKVVVVNNGQEALEAFDLIPFDVVLMDVQMPEMDGIEATAAIRSREASTGKHVPIIALTAYAMKGDRESCLTAGMDRYISKPIRAKELFEAVEGSVPSPELESDRPIMPAGPGDDILDSAAALSRVGDDKELLAELAAIFLKECPRLLEDIRSGIAAHDVEKFRCAAHGLKGAIDNFVARPAFEAALRLEMLGRTGNLVDASVALADLEGELQRLTPLLAQVAAGAPGGGR